MFALFIARVFCEVILLHGVLALAAGHGAIGLLDPKIAGEWMVIPPNMVLIHPHIHFSGHFFGLTQKILVDKAIFVKDAPSHREFMCF